MNRRRFGTIAASIGAAVVMTIGTGAASATPSVKSEVAASVQSNIPSKVSVVALHEAPALVTAITGTTGGGTYCLPVTSYGTLCSTIYESSFVTPYAKLTQSPTSPTVPSAVVVVRVCGADIYGKCRDLGSGYKQTFNAKLGLNKRPRCGTLIWGGTTNGPYCRLGGVVYSMPRGKVYWTETKFYVGGVLKKTVNSPKMKTG